LWVDFTLHSFGTKDKEWFPMDAAYLQQRGAEREHTFSSAERSKRGIKTWRR
jgi:hypothetical protein